mgnify:CR=1 FL=1
MNKTIYGFTELSLDEGVREQGPKQHVNQYKKSIDFQTSLYICSFVEIEILCETQFFENILLKNEMLMAQA